MRRIKRARRTECSRMKTKEKRSKENGRAGRIHAIRRSFVVRGRVVGGARVIQRAQKSREQVHGRIDVPAGIDAQ